MNNLNKQLIADEDKVILFEAWIDLNKALSPEFQTDKKIEHFTVAELMTEVNEMLLANKAKNNF